MASGSLGSVVRTVLFVAGMGMVLFGIVSLAYPPALGLVLPGVGASFGAANPRGPVPRSGGSAGLAPSFGLLVWGLTVTAAGLATPGRSSFPTVPDPRFSRRDRLYVWTGTGFLVVLPLAITLLLPVLPFLITAVIPAILLALVGAILVTIGATRGLK